MLRKAFKMFYDGGLAGFPHDDARIGQILLTKIVLSLTKTDDTMANLTVSLPVSLSLSLVSTLTASLTADGPAKWGLLSFRFWLSAAFGCPRCWTSPRRWTSGR